MKAILEKLQEKNVYKITESELSEILERSRLEKEVSTGLAGPIKILQQADIEKRLIVETDQSGDHFIRLLEPEYIQEFINERLSVYDKMWDGCGCKVFYNEVWSTNKERTIF